MNNAQQAQQTTHAKHPTRRYDGEQSGWFALGFVAIVLGALLWIIGARYTLIGWIAGFNLVLSMTGLPIVVPTPVGWWWLLAIPAGFFYSAIELYLMPGPPNSVRNYPIWLLAISLVLFVHGTDIGSTLVGYLAPSANPWPLHSWAQTDGLPLLVFWSIILTYIPERAILLGLQLLGVTRATVKK